MYTVVVLCLALSRNELQIFVGFVLRAADEVELDNKKLNKKEILAQPRRIHADSILLVMRAPLSLLFDAISDGFQAVVAFEKG